jgi:very-short-patch-repair endonuclease
MDMARAEKSPRSLRVRPPLEKGAGGSAAPGTSNTERKWAERAPASEAFPPLKKGGEGGFRSAPYQARLKPLARDLRSNLTDAEQLLWHHLRRKQLHGVQFYRQKPLGPYIVDFYAPAAKLVVEVDGAQHLTNEGQSEDTQRDDALASIGLTVLRFDNRQVLMETNAVLSVIEKHVALAVDHPAAGVGNPPCPPKSPLSPFSKGGSE